MAIQLDEKIKKLLQDKETIKVVTTDENGTPHAVIKQTLHLDEDGYLAYLELLESSQANKNLVRGIWFNRKVAIVLKGKDGQSYQIIGKPVKAVIGGAVGHINTDSNHGPWPDGEALLLDLIDLSMQGCGRHFQPSPKPGWWPPQPIPYDLEKPGF